MTAAVEVARLAKSYGATRALDGIDFTVEEGTVLGLLGPNGAGKTTVVRILTTLLAPDAGSARVLGLDVVRDAERLRAVIGLAGQYAAVDGLLTGRENLRMVGDLYHLSGADSRRRADELLDRFGLVDAADRIAKGYSGGMRRRLDLAASLVNRPPMLFLDEPTTGLDPRSRVGLWEVIEGLVADGTTLLLTTQYLDEADRLSDRIAVIDDGRLIAEGTADELKDSAGGQVVEVRLATPADSPRAVEALRALASDVLQPGSDPRVLRLPGADGIGLVTDVARTLSALGIEVNELGLRRPTLDDVFLQLTGKGADELPAEDAPEEGTGRRGRGRRTERSSA